MQELDVTWGRTFRVWWLIVWRGMLGAILIGAIIGGLFGFVIGALGLPTAIVTTVSPILGAVVGLIWALCVTRMSLRKKYSDFRIALVPRAQ